MNIHPCLRIITQTKNNENNLSSDNIVKFSVWVANVCEASVVVTIKTILKISNLKTTVLTSTLDGIKENQIINAQTGKNKKINGEQRIAIPSSLSSGSSIKEVGSVTLVAHSIIQEGGKIEFTARIGMPRKWLDSKTVIINMKPCQ